MKKLMLVVVFVLCLGIYPEKSFAIDIKQYSNEEISKLNENSKEKIYQDLIICLFSPYIQKEVDNYYQEYLSEMPTVFPDSIDVINIKRESGYGIQSELIVHPFVGPYNYVGDDRIIIETGAYGYVKVVKFEHLKSYKLPWNWQHIIKKS
ncbi:MULTISPECIES: DUF3888 domain-containing protein [unclassified Clostridium]|uniref:DUF3888 domain-containing protein n=1 Tax=unclassified Clostridium TaxID=2614128 RepID=UPI000297CF54|nr:MULTISPECIES: DUF3888 domain-containing protein [unclassified Clostridium]EKQ50227.1 MAG: hypothetical protein A370_05814 [Clostridium sp. Maddingley MBC34-26]